MTSFVNRPAASGIVSMKRELEISRYQQVAWCKEFASWRSVLELVRGSELESIAVWHGENRCWQQPCGTRSEREIGWVGRELARWMISVARCAYVRDATHRE